MSIWGKVADMEHNCSGRPDAGDGTSQSESVRIRAQSIANQAKVCLCTVDPRDLILLNYVTDMKRTLLGCATRLKLAGVHHHT